LISQGLKPALGAQNEQFSVPEAATRTTKIVA
jgi:hypothetical protein